MADEEERRPLRHLKFREFENVSGDLTADEIRRLYASKKPTSAKIRGLSISK